MGSEESKSERQVVTPWQSRVSPLDRSPSRPPTRSRGMVVLGSALVLLVLATSGGDAWLLARGDRTDERVEELTHQIAQLRAGQRTAAAHLSALGTKVTGDEAGTLDASQVATIAKPAVFTVVAGPFLGTAFGFYKDGGGTYLVTNYHVVQTATLTADKTVTLRQQKESWTGVVTKWNSHFDLALVRVSADLPILRSASADGHRPVVGEPVLAYGSPYGLEDTATLGIISAFRKQFVQTDAPINHGNSGGPLLDRYADVIGITSYGVAGGGSGLGLAIDIGEVCQVLVSADIC
jgi:S1-C subfamily serine protease